MSMAIHPPVKKSDKELKLLMYGERSCTYLRRNHVATTHDRETCVD